MDLSISNQIEEYSLSTAPNLEEKPKKEIKQHLVGCLQKGSFHPLEPIYEEEEEQDASSCTSDICSCTGSTTSSLSGSKLPSITIKTKEKLYEWTKFIKPENLGKTVITDLKRKYAPFEHKKVKSALEDECDKEIVSQEWPLILDLENHISYFPYSDIHVVQDLKLDSMSKFPGYEEKKPKDKRLAAQTEESRKEEDIRTTMFLPSITSLSIGSTPSIITSLLGRKLDAQSIPTLKRQDFMQLMNDAEKAEFQKLIEELDTDKHDDPQIKREQKLQEELHYLSDKAPPPPKVISSVVIKAEGPAEQADYEESEGSREEETAEDMGEGKVAIPVFPELVAETPKRGVLPAFPETTGETSSSETIGIGESSIPSFLKYLGGESERSERVERGEGSIPEFPEVAGETTTTERMQRQDLIPPFSQIGGENETSRSMESEKRATSKSSESITETETSETSEVSASLMSKDQEIVPLQGEAASYVKYKPGEGEGEFLRGMPYQLLEAESAKAEDYALLRDIVKTAEIEAQKLVGPTEINLWEEDYNICFVKYLKTLPEAIRNLIDVTPKELLEQSYEYSSEGTGKLLEGPGISDTIRSDNLLIDQDQLISLPQKQCPAEVPPTATDCKDEVWVPKLNIYYAYTEEVHPAHRLGHFMCTALASLQHKPDADPLLLDTEDLEIDKEIRVLPNRYCLEFWKEDPYDEYKAELKFLRLKPLRCIIFGKPGLESKQLGKKLADYWRCIYIDVCEELKKELESETNVAQVLKNILQAGEAAPSALVFRILLQRILQPLVTHRGYILDGFPYHSKENDLAPLDQLQGLFSWEYRPSTIIYLACPDADVIRKREERYYDSDADSYYSSGEIALDNTIRSLYMPKESPDYSIQLLTSLTEQKFKTPKHLSWAKSFVRRELDFKLNILNELDYYTAKLLPCIEYFILQYDPQFVIRVDGRRDFSDIFQVVMQRLITLPVQRSVAPQPFFPLPPEEPEKIDITQLMGELRGEGRPIPGEGGPIEEAQEQEEEAEAEGAAAEGGEAGEGEFEDPFLRLSPADVIEALSKRDIISPQFTWQLSRWQFNCPVSLFEGITKMGETRFSVRYMDKIYFLSSVEALKKFCRNPRRYLMPPYPKPGCKYIIVGPQYFGRSLLALYIAEVFGAKIILFEDLKDRNTRKKRKEHIDACRKDALEKAIASTTEMLNQEWLEAEDLRLQQCRKWRNDACTLLLKYMEYLLQPPVEITQLPEGSTGTIAEQSRCTRLAEIAMLLEDIGIPITQDSKLAEELMQNTQRLMKFRPPHLEPLAKPATPDITHPRVCKAVDEAVFKAQKDRIELTQEELIALIYKDISDAEQDLMRRTNGQVTSGGWVIDGVPLNLQLWKKMVACGMIPDHVICLMDTKPDVRYWHNQLVFPLFNFSLELLCKAAKLRNKKYKYLPEYFSELFTVPPTTDDMVFPAEKSVPSDDEEEQEGERGSLHESSEMGPPNTEDSMVSTSSSNEESFAFKEYGEYESQLEIVGPLLQAEDAAVPIPSPDLSKTASIDSGTCHCLRFGAPVPDTVFMRSIIASYDKVLQAKETSENIMKSVITDYETLVHAKALSDRKFMKSILDTALQPKETLQPEAELDESSMKTILSESLKEVYGEGVISDASYIRGLVLSLLPSSKRISDQRAIMQWIYETWNKTIYAYHYSDFCIDYPSDKEEEPELICDDSEMLLADKIQLLQKRQLQQELEPIPEEYKGESMSQYFVKEIYQFNKDWAKVKKALGPSLAPLEINIHNRNMNDIIRETTAKIEDEFRVHPEPYHSEALPAGEQLGEFVEEIKEDILIGDTGEYCPVALHNNFVLWNGRKDLALKYYNKVYYFSTEEAMDEFMLKPHKFAPISKPPCELPPLRICFIGPIGSGKKTFGKLFSLRLGIRLVSLNEEINKFVESMGWMPMGRVSQNFFISVSKEELGEEGEADMEESSPEEEEGPEQNEMMGEQGEAQELSYGEKMLRDLEIYYAGGVLPEWLVEHIIVPLWTSKEAFILEGFPSGPEDVQLMRKYYLIPDIIFNLQASDKAASSRVLQSFLDIWQAQQDEEIRKVDQQDNETRMRYEKHKIRRRKELIWKIKLKFDMERLQEDLGEQAREAPEQQGEDEKGVSGKFSFSDIATEYSGEGYWDLQDIEFLEEWLDQQENSVKLKKELQKILDAEFPPLILAHTWEDEVHAAFRLLNIIKKWYNQDNKKIIQVRKPVKEMNIPWEDVLTEIPLDILMEDAAKKAAQLTRSDTMLEKTYEVSLEVATGLIECGYYFLSRFGYWCPVQVAEKTNPIQMFFPAKESGNVYPIIHRKYIYFIVGEENAEKFKKDPLKYINGELCTAVVPVRLAIIGPPKCGKTTLAQRLARKFGIKAISLGGAIRHVLQDMAETQLAKSILRFLRVGEVVPDYLAIRAVEVAALEDRSVGQGIVYDGFPNKISQISELAKYSLLPYAVIVLKSKKDHCIANLHRSDLTTFRKPLRYSDLYFEEMFNNWEKGALPTIEWMSQEYQNVIFLDADVSKWQLGLSIEQAVFSVMQSVQDYFINVIKGLPTQVQYLCVNRSEWEQRKTFGILHFCPVCLKEKSLVTSGPNPDRSGLLQYLCHLYWVCSNHKGHFMRNPENYTPSPDCCLPDEMPERVDARVEFGELFADGLCVVCYHGKHSHGQLNKGLVINAVRYNKFIYLFCSEECLANFMRCPHLYKDLKIHFRNFDLPFADSLQEIPVQGFLEQTVYETIIKCLSFVGTLRPKILCTTVEISAAVYLGILLKVNNKKGDIEIRKKYQVVLKQFLKKKGKVEQVTKMMTSVANPHFDWMKEIAETVHLPKKVHKKKEEVVEEEIEESLPEQPPTVVSSFGPCGYIYPVQGEQGSSISTFRTIQSPASVPSGYRGRAPTPQSTSATSSWRS